MAYGFNKTRAQAATELAVFGAVLIFLIGAIVRTATSNSYQQNQQLKAMRLALLKSYQGSTKPKGQEETRRNSSTVLYIEDKLTPDIGKFGSMDRSPVIMQGAGTMSNLLMYPVDEADLRSPKHIPVMDILINGKQFTLTTAAFSENKILNRPSGTPPSGRRFWKGWDFQCTPTGPCPVFYQVVLNEGSTASDYGVLDVQAAFDLNRDDDYSNDPITQDERNRMAWHWKGIQGIVSNIKIDKTNDTYPSYDVDNDRQEETVYAVFPAVGTTGVINKVSVYDFQDGDLNFSHDDTDGGPTPGLQSDMSIFTKTREGTILQIKEGKLYNLSGETGSFVRSLNFNDQAETIQRTIVISNKTNTLCQGDVPVAPVEACGDCFSQSNMDKTCFQTTANLDTGKPEHRLFVRSRISEKRGHKWKTDISEGP